MARATKSPELDALETLQGSLEELEALLPTLGPSASKRAQSRLEEIAQGLLRLRATMPKAPQAITSIMLQLMELLALTTPGLSKTASSTLRTALSQIGGALAKAVEDLDPVRTPRTVFDPSRPDATGRLVALALLAQPRLPLAEVGQMYGSGCYAIYYSGDHPDYSPISGTETPIYVGKANPAHPEAKNPRDQGPKLTGRLCDHRRMLLQVEEWAVKNPSLGYHSLRVIDFSYRRLVVTTNSQLVAEQYLINFFKPIWNKETNICWGISKHGDDAGTRGNKRAPWDVLHPGRDWAMDERLENSKSCEVISENIATHFALNQPYRNIHTIIDFFMRDFQQDAVELGGVDAPEEESEA